MRGGRREGAGRHREEETVLFPVRITKHTRAFLKDMAEARRISVGEMLTRLALDREFRQHFDD